MLVYVYTEFHNGSHNNTPTIYILRPELSCTDPAIFCFYGIIWSVFPTIYSYNDRLCFKLTYACKNNKKHTCIIKLGNRYGRKTGTETLYQNFSCFPLFGKLVRLEKRYGRLNGIHTTFANRNIFSDFV